MLETSPSGSSSVSSGSALPSPLNPAAEAFSMSSKVSSPIGTPEPSMAIRASPSPGGGHQSARSPDDAIASPGFKTHAFLTALNAAASTPREAPASSSPERVQQHGAVSQAATLSRKSGSGHEAHGHQGKKISRPPGEDESVDLHRAQVLAAILPPEERPASGLKPPILPRPADKDDDFDVILDEEVGLGDVHYFSMSPASAPLEAATASSGNHSAVAPGAYGDGAAIEPDTSRSNPGELGTERDGAAVEPDVSCGNPHDSYTNAAPDWQHPDMDTPSDPLPAADRNTSSAVPLTHDRSSAPFQDEAQEKTQISGAQDIQDDAEPMLKPNMHTQIEPDSVESSNFQNSDALSPFPQYGCVEPIDKAGQEASTVATMLVPGCSAETSDHERALESHAWANDTAGNSSQHPAMHAEQSSAGEEENAAQPSSGKELVGLDAEIAASQRHQDATHDKALLEGNDQGGLRATSEATLAADQVPAPENADGMQAAGSDVAVTSSASPGVQPWKNATPEIMEGIENEAGCTCEAALRDADLSLRHDAADTAVADQQALDFEFSPAHTAPESNVFHAMQDFENVPVAEAVATDKQDPALPSLSTSHAQQEPMDIAELHASEEAEQMPAAEASAADLQGLASMAPFNSTVSLPHDQSEPRAASAYDVIETDTATWNAGADTDQHEALTEASNDAPAAKLVLDAKAADRQDPALSGMMPVQQDSEPAEAFANIGTDPGTATSDAENDGKAADQHEAQSAVSDTAPAAREIQQAEATDRHEPALPSAIAAQDMSQPTEGLVISFSAEQVPGAKLADRPDLAVSSMIAAEDQPAEASEDGALRPDSFSLDAVANGKIADLREAHFQASDAPSASKSLPTTPQPSSTPDSSSSCEPVRGKNALSAHALGERSQSNPVDGLAARKTACAETSKASRVRVAAAATAAAPDAADQTLASQPPSHGHLEHTSSSGPHEAWREGPHACLQEAVPGRWRGEAETGKEAAVEADNVSKTLADTDMAQQAAVVDGPALDLLHNATSFLARRSGDWSRVRKTSILTGGGVRVLLTAPQPAQADDSSTVSIRLQLHDVGTASHPCS